MIGDSTANKQTYQRTYQKYIDKLTHLRTTNSTARRLPAMPQHQLIPTSHKQPIQYQQQPNIESQRVTDQHNASSSLHSILLSRHNLRYKTQQSHTQTQQDVGLSKTIRCMIPGAKVRALSFCSHHIASHNQSAHLINNSLISSQKQNSMKKLADSTSKDKIKQELHSNESIKQHSPQKNARRTVIHKQTIILSTTQSCLFQLSMLNNCMLIAAHLLGTQNNCLTLSLHQQQTHSLITHYRQNYSLLCADITLKQLNGLYCGISLKRKDKGSSPYDDRRLDNKNAVHQKNNNHKSTVCARNYFMIRNCQDNSQQKSTEQPNNTAKPKLNNQQLSALIARLHPTKQTGSLKSITNLSASPHLKRLASLSTKKPRNGVLKSVRQEGKKGRVMKSNSDCDMFVDSQLVVVDSQLVGLQKNRLKINSFIEQSDEIYSMDESDQAYYNEFIEDM